MDAGGPRSLKFPCKVWPNLSHPAFPGEAYHWAPLINVRLSYQHSPPTKWFEAWVDSGADCCIFHADLCTPLGIKMLSGIREDLGGIISGPKMPMYFHKGIKIQIGAEMIEVTAAFCPGLSAAGVLGRRGFFERFIVKIDSSTLPPYCELEKIHRA